MKNYEVIAGNIGTVYTGIDLEKALETFSSYVQDSKNGYGRVSGEPVYLFVDGEPEKEYEPPESPEGEPEILDFEILDFGIEHAQYFQGLGTCFSQYDNAAIGVGDNPKEAIEDLLEMISQQTDLDTTGDSWDRFEKAVIEQAKAGRDSIPDTPSVYEELKEQAEAEYEETVKANLEGIEHVSTGVCGSCPDCQTGSGLSPRAFFRAVQDGDYYEGDNFSWGSCDCCNSGLGGNRTKAHGIGSDGKIICLEICHDCVFYLEYGDIPENLEPSEESELYYYVGIRWNEGIPQEQS